MALTYLHISNVICRISDGPSTPDAAHRHAEELQYLGL